MQMAAINWHTLVSDIMHPVSLQCDMAAMQDSQEPSFDNLAASA